MVYIVLISRTRWVGMDLEGWTLVRACRVVAGEGVYLRRVISNADGWWGSSLSLARAIYIYIYIVVRSIEIRDGHEVLHPRLFGHGSRRFTSTLLLLFLLRPFLISFTAPMSTITSIIIVVVIFILGICICIIIIVIIIISAVHSLLDPFPLFLLLFFLLGALGAILFQFSVLFLLDGLTFRHEGLLLLLFLVVFVYTSSRTRYVGMKTR